MKTLKEMEKAAKEAITDFPVPLYDAQIFGVSFFVNRRLDFGLFLVETEPYELDGTTPLIVVQFLWFEFIFENKRLYKYLYNKKYGFNPLGLC